MVARKFTVFLEPAEEGGFIVKCGELPVATQGETREEALKNIKEAIEGYLEAKAKLLGSKIKGEKAEVIVETRALSTRPRLAQGGRNLSTAGLLHICFWLNSS
jgi:predicted RNase H-like HicB family nuclease